jgi:hypothetical protein
MFLVISDTIDDKDLWTPATGRSTGTKFLLQQSKRAAYRAALDAISDSPYIDSSTGFPQCAERFLQASFSSAVTRKRMEDHT